MIKITERHIIDAEMLWYTKKPVRYTRRGIIAKQINEEIQRQQVQEYWRKKKNDLSSMPPSEQGTVFPRDGKTIGQILRSEGIPTVLRRRNPRGSKGK